MTHGTDTAWRDELGGLLAALREDMLTAEQGERLNCLLRESDAALATYIRAIAMQADLIGYLVGCTAAEPVGEDGEAEADGADGAVGAASGPRSQFQDTLYGLTVAEAALRPHPDDEEEPLTLPPWSPRVDEPPQRLRLGSRVWAALGAVAAVLVIALGLWLRSSWADPEPTPVAASGAKVDLAASQPTEPTVEIAPTVPVVPPAPPPPPPVVATLSASVGALWEGPDSPKLESSLRAGRSINLAGGYARLTFLNGVDVVIEAPARVTLESGTRLALERGRMTAKVPVVARGFTVATDLVEVVDLGTEFGVSVAPDGAVDVPVFTGLVEARPPSRTAAATQPASIVEAGQTGRAKDSGLKVVPAGPDAADYVRDIRNIRGPLPTHGTGQALKVGDPDPHWQIVAASNDPTWAPRPAIVCGPGTKSMDNDARSAWVSTSGERPSVAGGRYTFATTFDLTGFDPATATLRVALGVDDFIREVRLNGRPTDITLSLPRNLAKRQLTASDITDGFVPGVNRLEVVVENGAGPGTKDRPNAMALRAEVSGTAVRQLDTR